MILRFLVKNFYFQFYDSSLQVEFILYVPCRVKKAFLTTLVWDIDDLDQDLMLLIISVEEDLHFTWKLRHLSF